MSLSLARPAPRGTRHSLRRLAIVACVTLALFAISAPALLRVLADASLAPEAGSVAAPGTAAIQTVPGGHFPERPTLPLYGKPVRISIPAIGVDAPVVTVGIGADGVMGTPSGASDTGWLATGARPGEYGSAVIAGHSGYRTAPAVFDDLGLLAPGDIVRVLEAGGTTIEFRVTDSRRYDPSARPAEVFSATDGRHLNLITCTGEWDFSTRSHTQRLVVFTEAVR